MASHRKSAGKSTSEFGLYAERARHGVPRKVWEKSIGRGARTGLFIDAVREPHGSKGSGKWQLLHTSKGIAAPSDKYAARLGNERAARVLYYFELAGKAFGDKKLAQKFMARRHPKLGMAPIEKLDTEWGGREVEQILNSIVYGFPA